MLASIIVAGEIDSSSVLEVYITEINKAINYPEFERHDMEFFRLLAASISRAIPNS